MSSPTKPPCLTAALEYLARGWSPLALCPPDHKGSSPSHVSSCNTPGKSPWFSWSAYQDRLPRTTELQLFWTRTPASNVGIVLGPVSGLLGLDIDSEEGATLLASKSQTFPKTIACSTAKGRHLLFRWPTATEPPRTQSIVIDGREALRIQAAGSQITVPPSIHHTGHQYQWLPGQAPGDIEPADCPDWILALFQKPEPTPHTPLHHPTSLPEEHRARAYAKAFPPAVAGAGGHNTTYRLACRLVHGFHLDQPDALAIMLTHFNPRCDPPWTEQELAHKVNQAHAKGHSPDMTAQSSPLPTPAHPTPPPQAQTKPYTEIMPTQVEWLWPSYIPLGKLTMLDGDPGLGKSTLLLDLAARVSSNGLMPSGIHGPTGTVLIMSAEDAPQDCIRPRLEAAAANLANIFDLSTIIEKGKGRPIEIPHDLPLIHAIMTQIQPRLWIIDPLMAYLNDVDANKDQSIRRCLYQISQIAEDTRTSVIAMRHLNKGSGTKALYRGNSSIGVIGHARAGFLVAADTQNPRRRILACTKANYGPTPASLAFSLVPDGNVCKIGWEGPANMTADDLLQPMPSTEQQEEQETKATKIQEAATIIQHLLSTGGGKVEIIMAKQECQTAAISRATVERAAKQLNLIMTYTTDNDGQRRYYWSPKTPVP